MLTADHVSKVRSLHIPFYRNAAPAMAVNPNYGCCILGFKDGHVVTYDLDKQYFSFKRLAHFNNINTITVNQDGTKFITTSSDLKACLWDISSKEAIHAFVGHEQSVVTAAFDRTETKVITGSEDGTVKIWDLTTKKILHTLYCDPVRILYVDVGADNTSIITIKRNGVCIIWDILTGDELLNRNMYLYPISAALLNPDGNLLALANSIGNAIVFDIKQQRCLCALEGHEGAIKSIDFSPDGSKILTVADDRTAIIWDTWTGQKLTQWYVSQYFKPAGGKFWRNDRQVIAIGDYATIALWQLDPASGLG